MHIGPKVLSELLRVNYAVIHSVYGINLLTLQIINRVLITIEYTSLSYI